MRGPLYSADEDARLLRLRRGGMTFPDIACLMPQRSKESLNHRYLLLADPAKMSKPVPSRHRSPATKSRTCLIGAHPFNARIDDNGRFLEHICKACRATDYYRCSIYVQAGG